MGMWIPKSDLVMMGISEATIYRRTQRDGEWRSRVESASGREGRPSKEYLLESLPGELQMKWQRMKNCELRIAECGIEELSSERRASAAVVDRPAPRLEEPAEAGTLNERYDDASLEESDSKGNPRPDDRLQRLAAALARFSPPRYTLDQRQAVENRCLELSAICDQVIALSRKGKGRRKISNCKSQISENRPGSQTDARAGTLTVRSPGASEAGRNRSYSPALIQLAKRAASSDPTYTEMYPSAQHPPSVFTLLKWTKQYRKSGPVVFIRQTQTLRPEIDERFKDVPPRAVEWLQSNYESYSSGALSQFGKKWMEFCRRQKIEMPFEVRSQRSEAQAGSVRYEWRPGAPGSCYAWLHNWRRRLPQLARTLAEEGQRSVEAKYGYIIRHYEDVRPRELWTMDWKQLDVCFWKPADKPGGSPRLVREWLCPALDVASRAPFGWHIQDRPNARGVTLAYLDGVSRSAWKQDPELAMLCGVQRVSGSGSGVPGSGPGDRKPRLHLDNGKDFRSHTIEGQTIHIKGFDLETGLLLTLRSYDVGLAADFDLTIQNAKVRNAKAKIVEPWFRYAIGLWEEGMPGYCGNRPENKPHWFAAAVRLHKAFAKRENGKPADLRELPNVWREEFERSEAEYGVGTPFLSEQEFRARFTGRLLEYLQSPHGSLRDVIGDMSPVAHLNAYADSPHMLTEQSTAILLMIPRTETVINGEIKMTWAGESFIYRAVAGDLGTDAALYNLPYRAKVEVRYDPNAIGRVLVLNEGGPVCWAENPQLLGWNARAEDLRAAGQKKKERDRAGREYWDKQTQPAPDWQNEAEARQNVVQLKRAVGDEGSGFGVQGPGFEQSSDFKTQISGDSEPAPGAGLAGVTKLTRFDGKGAVQGPRSKVQGPRSEVRGQKSEVSGFQGLTLVEEEAEDLEPWALSQMPEAEGASEDDVIESLLASSEEYLNSLGRAEE
ncbi:MAG: hypothetical protein AABN33_18185 [Acidobacteriota bacterium]